MSMGQLFVIGIIILLVVPPEKLPGLARELARFLNDLRRSTAGVWDEIKKDTPNPMDEIRKQKQEMQDYLKTIGSNPEHHVDNSTFQPVDTTPAYRHPEPQPPVAPTLAPPNITQVTQPQIAQQQTTPVSTPADEPRTDKKSN